MKKLLLLLLITGCTTVQPPVAETPEEPIATKKPEVKDVKKPTPVVKKPEVKVETKAEPKETKEPEKEVPIIASQVDDMQLKRQTLFAVACEQHPIVKGLATQYQRSIVKFADTVAQTKDKSKSFAMVVVNYQLKTGGDKPIAQVICNVNEAVDKGKPSYKIDKLMVNGIAVK